MSGTAGPAIARFIGKAVGDDSLRGLSLSSGAQILGMIVDNFSGSWLYVPQTQQYVPPYVAGWASIVSPANAALDFIYQAGPIGLASSSSGSPAVVQLFSTAVQNSPGIAIQAQSIVIATTRISFAPQIPANVFVPVDLVVPTSSQRIRIWRITSAYDYITYLSTGGAILSPVGLLYASILTGSPSVGIENIGISPESPTFSIDYPNGLDLPVGAKLRVDNAKCLFGSSGPPVIASVVYTLL